MVVYKSDYTLEEVKDFLGKQDFTFEPIFIPYTNVIPKEESAQYKKIAEKLKEIAKQN